jgi:hypothetical protein
MKSQAIVAKNEALSVLIHFVMGDEHPHLNNNKQFHCHSFNAIQYLLAVVCYTVHLLYHRILKQV